MHSTIIAVPGDIAQLIERCIRIAEVGGLNPPISTIVFIQEEYIIIKSNNRREGGNIMWKKLRQRLSGIREVLDSHASYLLEGIRSLRKRG